VAAALSAPGTRPRRRGTGLTVAVSAFASLGLAVLVVGKWDELSAGITGAPALVVVAAVALQALALVSRSEAWYVCVRASGGTVGRRRLYRASSMGFVGGLVNGQLSSAARIAALRRSAPKTSPRVSALIAAELPILIVEAMLAALTSFTLVGPLGLPWWLPLVCVAAVVGVSLSLRSLALAKRRWLADGLAVTRSLRGRSRLVGFVLVAVLAQVARNWLLLHAVGVDASVFDAIAVLIAVVSLGQLPFGLSVGAAASVLILGPEGVAAAAAAGVLLTATGTVGGLCFAAWAALDVALSDRHVRVLARRLRSGAQHLASPAQPPWNGLATLPAQMRRAVERTCFDCLGQLQLHAALAPASGDGLPPVNYLTMEKVTMEKGNPSTTRRVRPPWSASFAPAMRPGARQALSSRGRRS
jgi:uncharacterized membrane protein YbhN (UPF0104 family)